jgi:hypothetical protein
VRLRILELPLKNPGADFTFALVVDDIADLGEDFIDALRAFGDQIGAAGVLVTDGLIDLPGTDVIDVETDDVLEQAEELEEVELLQSDQDDTVPDYGR